MPVFLTAEPGAPVTSRYAYAANDPINLVDPLGLAPVDSQFRSTGTFTITDPAACPGWDLRPGSLGCGLVHGTGRTFSSLWQVARHPRATWDSLDQSFIQWQSVTGCSGFPENCLSQFVADGMKADWRPWPPDPTEVPRTPPRYRPVRPIPCRAQR